ncbi:MAG: hypothetical protein JWN25_1026 [Verrucomicrobiales bacterium]|nr:hypothetical protein [Verrucomicrobiales bacterium]
MSCASCVRLENPQISGKKVSFSCSKDYDFIPSLLGSVRVSQIEPSSSQGDQNLQLVEWCSVVEVIRTHFSRKPE